MSSHPLVPDNKPIVRVDSQSGDTHHEGATLATDDHELIRQWAARHSAEPATGEATESGPATVNVQDGDAGIRFNFPAAGRFRAISWEEWFRNFTQYDLVFVYEGDVPGRTPAGRYRLVPRHKLEDASSSGW